MKMQRTFSTLDNPQNSAGMGLSDIHGASKERSSGDDLYSRVAAHYV